MSEESLVPICPNPKCRMEIAEPIMLTVLSTKPPKQYEACPFCFTELEKPELEQELEQEELQKETEATESPEVEEEDEEELEAEEIIETEDDLPETEAQETGFLGKVRALIPRNGSKKEKEKKNKEPEVEEAYEDDEDYDEELEDFAVVEEETIELSEELGEDFEAYEEETAETEEEPEPEVKPSVPQESEQEGCPEEFGYLANRLKDAPIPQVCFVCPKMVDCMLSTRDD